MGVSWASSNMIVRVTVGQVMRKFWANIHEPAAIPKQLAKALAEWSIIQAQRPITSLPVQQIYEKHQDLSQE